MLFELMTREQAAELYPTRPTPEEKMQTEYERHVQALATTAGQIDGNRESRRHRAHVERRARAYCARADRYYGKTPGTMLARMRQDEARLVGKRKPSPIAPPPTEHQRGRVAHWLRTIAAACAALFRRRAQ